MNAINILFIYKEQNLSYFNRESKSSSSLSIRKAANQKAQAFPKNVSDSHKAKRVPIFNVLTRLTLKVFHTKMKIVALRSLLDGQK